MNFRLDWLAEAIRTTGLTLVETDSWKSRGHGDFISSYGILLHDTAGRITGPTTSLQTCIHGREPSVHEPDGLPGPLCNLYIDRNGAVYCIAAGLAYHAGKGTYRGVTNGNAHFIGIEIENNGVDEKWTDELLASTRAVVRALLKHIGAPTIMCGGHKEYAEPHGRKVDPDIDMDAFRTSLDTATDDHESPHAEESPPSPAV